MTTADYLTKFLQQLEACQPSVIQYEPEISPTLAPAHYKLFFTTQMGILPHVTSWFTLKYYPKHKTCAISTGLWQLEDQNMAALACAERFAQICGCDLAHDTSFSNMIVGELIRKKVAGAPLLQEPSQVWLTDDDRKSYWLGVLMTTTNAIWRQLATEQINAIDKRPQEQQL